MELHTKSTLIGSNAFQSKIQVICFHS